MLCSANLRPQKRHAIFLELHAFFDALFVGYLQNNVFAYMCFIAVPYCYSGAYTVIVVPYCCIFPITNLVIHSSCDFMIPLWITWFVLWKKNSTKTQHIFTRVFFVSRKRKQCRSMGEKHHKQLEKRCTYSMLHLGKMHPKWAQTPQRK